MDVLFPGLANAPHLHPLFVHFPLAFWWLAAGMLVWSSLKKRPEGWEQGRLLLALGTVCAVLAVVTGLRAEDALGHDSPGHDLIHVHKRWMLCATALGVLATLLSAHPALRRRVGVASIVTVLAASTAAVAALGADRGARLVFQFGIGTQGDPPPAAPPHHHEAEVPAASAAPSEPEGGGGGARVPESTSDPHEGHLHDGHSVGTTPTTATPSTPEVAPADLHHHDHGNHTP